MYNQLTLCNRSREFYIYLFAEALLCVSDDAKKGIGRMMDGLHSSPSGDKLRLKGRVYIRHISRVEDTSHSATPDSDGEYTLTITMVVNSN